MMLDVKALHEALDLTRKQRKLYWRDVAKQAGLSPSTLSRIGQGASPDVDGLLRLLVWMGTTDLGPFLLDAVEPARRPILRLGRHNKQLVYSQQGAEPSDADVLLAACMSSYFAAALVDRCNRAPTQNEGLAEEEAP